MQRDLAVGPTVAAAYHEVIAGHARFDTFVWMKHSRSPGIAVFIAGASLFMAAASTQAVMLTATECRLPLELLSAQDINDFGCMPPARRVALLISTPEQFVLPPLDRELRLQSALQRLKAQESEALAVPNRSAGNALDAYLTGREIESGRSAALRNTRRELAKTESSMVRKGADLALAATAATDWVRRQPGRDLPQAYRQRVVSAAAAILADDLQRQRLESACDAVNREYDRKLTNALRVNS